MLLTETLIWVDGPSAIGGVADITRKTALLPLAGLEHPHLTWEALVHSSVQELSRPTLSCDKPQEKLVDQLVLHFECVSDCSVSSSVLILGFCCSGLNGSHAFKKKLILNWGCQLCFILGLIGFTFWYCIFGLAPWPCYVKWLAQWVINYVPIWKFMCNMVQGDTLELPLKLIQEHC